MLKGEYSHNIDAKGRLIIPAKFRDDLGENFVITKGMENCLYVYPEQEWNAFEEKLNALPTTTDSNANRFAAYVWLCGLHLRHCFLNMNSLHILLIPANIRFPPLFVIVLI